MLRLAFGLLAALVALLLALALLPQRPRMIPESTIELEQVSVTLYPRADPEAVWRFVAPRVEYQPNSRETVLYRIEDGARQVGGATDFTLESEEVIIDSSENLRGESMVAHLIEEGWDLEMAAANGQQVFINQQAGLFEVPHLEWRGEGGSGVNENMRISFDLTTFTSGGEGTVGYSEFDIGDPDEPPGASPESEEP